MDNEKGTIEPIFRVGPLGPIIKNNAGILEVRNPDDSGTAKLVSSATTDDITEGATHLYSNFTRPNGTTIKTTKAVSIGNAVTITPTAWGATLSGNLGSTGAISAAGKLSSGTSVQSPELYNKDGLSIYAIGERSLLTILGAENTDSGGNNVYIDGGPGGPNPDGNVCIASLFGSCLVGFDRRPEFKLEVEGPIGFHTDDLYDFGSSSLRADDIYATNTTIQTSDARLKEDIQPALLGLDFIRALAPKSCKYKGYTIPESSIIKNKPKMKTVIATREVITKIEDHWVRTIKEYEKQEHDYIEHDLYDTEGNIIGVHKEYLYEDVEEIIPERTKAFTRRHYCFIAQDVEATLTGIGLTSADFAGLIYDPVADRYGIRIGEFVPILAKAIQELYTMITEE